MPERLKYIECVPMRRKARTLAKQTQASAGNQILGAEA